MAGILFHIPDAHSGVDEYTSMMLHGNESPLEDSSSYGNTLTHHGGIVRSATESKFGGYSIYCANNNQYITIGSPGSEFDFGISDMTLDFWAKNSGADQWQFYYTTDNVYCFSPDSTWTGGLGAPNGALQCNLGTGGADKYLWSDDGSWRGSTVWNHVAIVQHNRLAMMFINGVKQNKTADYSDFVPPALTKDIFVAHAHNGITSFPGGYLDEMRLSNGIARWTENFTPPTAAYF